MSSQKQIEEKRADIERMARELADSLGYSLERARELIAAEYARLSNALAGA